MGISYLKENTMERIRVLRIIEYTGERKFVEDLVERAIQGTKTFQPFGSTEPLIIRVATLGTYPEILYSDTGIIDTTEEPMYYR